ncbi:hypothetical protein K502DRAFT_363716 [Neoconidiobolus thromboides FSU 785]|nr:hypothetical protein K502DRAFT_363716 [Neoconidiobolus thromboides FSU 785]
MDDTVNAWNSLRPEIIDPKAGNLHRTGRNFKPSENVSKSNNKNINRMERSENRHGGWNDRNQVNISKVESKQSNESSINTNSRTSNQWGSIVNSNGTNAGQLHRKGNNFRPNKKESKAEYIYDKKQSNSNIKDNYLDDELDKMKPKNIVYNKQQDIPDHWDQTVNLNKDIRPNYMDDKYSNINNRYDDQNNSYHSYSNNNQFNDDDYSINNRGRYNNNDNYYHTDIGSIYNNSRNQYYNNNYYYKDKLRSHYYDNRNQYYNDEDEDNNNTCYNDNLRYNVSDNITDNRLRNNVEDEHIKTKYDNIEQQEGCLDYQRSNFLSNEDSPIDQLNKKFNEMDLHKLPHHKRIDINNDFNYSPYLFTCEIELPNGSQQKVDIFEMDNLMEVAFEFCQQYKIAGGHTIIKKLAKRLKKVKELYVKNNL